MKKFTLIFLPFDLFFERIWILYLKVICDKKTENNDLNSVI